MDGKKCLLIYLLLVLFATVQADFFASRKPTLRVIIAPLVLSKIEQRIELKFSSPVNGRKMILIFQMEKQQPNNPKKKKSEWNVCFHTRNSQRTNSV